jgi:hypothetical protein
VTAFHVDSKLGFEATKQIGKINVKHITIVLEQDMVVAPVTDTQGVCSNATQHS